MVTIKYFWFIHTDIHTHGRMKSLRKIKCEIRYIQRRDNELVEQVYSLFFVNLFEQRKDINFNLLKFCLMPPWVNTDRY